MSTIADFVPFVEIKVPHAPTPNIQHAVRETLVSFMRMSRAAVDEIYVDVPCNEREVIVEPRGCQRLVQVEHVFVDPTCRSGTRWNPDWDEMPDGERGAGGWWIDDVGGPNATLWLPYSQTRAQRLCIRYSWAIKRDNCEVPEWVYEDYADVIANGAITYLHMNPTDEDANLPFAERLSGVFMNGVAEARRRKEGQYRHRKVRMSNPSFFRG